MNVLMISICKGLVARNILQNDFFELAKKHFDKIIIISTAANDERFVREFGGEKVEIISALQCTNTIWDRIFIKCYRFLIYNKRTEMIARYDYQSEGSAPKRFPRIKYILGKIIFCPLSKLKFLRKVLRKIDFLFLQKDLVKEYRKIILQYKPNIVFSTNIVDDSEVALIKAARKERIRTYSMCKSWDNPSKMYFRVKSDIVAVWSDFMKKQIIRYQDYKNSKIEIVGVPQFDYYIDKSRLASREDFCRKNNLDPNKKIILFGSEGKLMPTDPEIVRVLQDLISEKKLHGDWQVFVRPHFAYTEDRMKFKEFFAAKNVVVDNSHNFSSGFSDMWDYSKEQMDHFLNSLYHSDIVMLTASTLALDAASLGKQIIFIKFDGYKKQKKRKSVAGWYMSDYYSEVVKYNVGYVAESPEQLREAINSYAKKDDIFKAQQEKLRSHFCYKIDGNSGKRLFEVISKY